MASLAFNAPEKLQGDPVGEKNRVVFIYNEHISRKNIQKAQNGAILIDYGRKPSRRRERSRLGGK
jgi:hypothetical protein